LATILGGLALDLISFPKGAEVGAIAPDTIYYLGLIAGPPAMIIGLAGLSFYFFYELSRERMEEIAEVLASRREETSAPLTPQVDSQIREPMGS
jgi:Na+/melibiose symporter-like transporter